MFYRSIWGFCVWFVIEFVWVCVLVYGILLLWCGGFVVLHQVLLCSTGFYCVSLGFVVFH